MSEIPPELSRQVAQGNAVLFVGEAIHGGRLPSSAQLAAALAQRCNYPAGDPLALPRVAGYYDLTRHARVSLIEFLRTELEPADLPPTRTYELVVRLRPSILITPCYDLLLARALAGVPHVPVIADIEVAYAQPDKILAIWLWGRLDRPESLALTEEERRRSLQIRSSLMDVLRAELARRAWLFVGFDGEDEGFRSFYDQGSRNLGAHFRPPFVASASLGTYARAWWGNYKAHFLEGEIEPLLADLAEAVDQARGRLTSAAAYASGPALSQPSPIQPYKGLDYYDTGDAGIFFGRAGETARLVTMIHAHRLTLVYGASGTGKTSLLLAGVAPQLAQADPPYEVFHVRVPDDPAAVIRAAVRRRLGAVLLPDDGSLVSFLSAAAAALGRPLLLILDQFEEFFSRLGAQARAAFIAELGALYDARDVPIKLVVSLREDGLAELAELEARIPAVFANRLRLLPLEQAAARAAIVEPARLLGFQYEPGLADRLLTELGGGRAVQPPQLSIVCSTLHSQLAADERVITDALYLRLGRAPGILGKYLKDELDRLPADQRSLAWALLAELVTSQGSKALKSAEELTAALRLTDEALARVLEGLVRARLVRPLEDADGSPAYELAHDYLAGEIVLKADVRDRKRAEEMLERAARDYAEPAPVLIDSGRLASIEAQTPFVTLTDAKLDLLFRSALAQGRSLAPWRQRALSDGRVAALADRWAAELQAQTSAGTALRLLVGLAHPAAISRLITLIESAAAGADHTAPAARLRSQGVIRQALSALAQMELAEAETYLCQLTPEGYAFVPAGPFEMGSDELPDEQPRRRVRLPAFWMAVSPVTVGEWQQFIVAGAYTAPEYWRDVQTVAQRARSAPAAWQRQHAQPQHPVRYVTWYEALAYTAWLSAWSGLPASLPTEAEWEKAAGWDHVTGQARRYPWGNQADPALCNVQESGTGEPLPVSQAPTTDSSSGIHDAVGAVLEWTRTIYRPYPYDPSDGREELWSESARVLRGGAYNLPVEEARCARRRVLDPAVSLSNTGCRVCLRVADVLSLQGPEHRARLPAAG